MPERLRITCSDLYRDADLLLDLFADGSFGAHDAVDLDPDDECFCAEPIVPGRWDEGNRRDANRRCRDRSVVIGDGWRLEACCRCVDRSGATREKLAEAGARIAQVLRSGAGAMHRDPTVSAAMVDYRNRGASSTEAQLAVSLDLLIGAAAGGAR